MKMKLISMRLKKNFNMKIKKRFLAGSIVGGAVGSIVGLMVAPKSGKQTRADLAKRGTALKNQVVKNSKTTSKKKSLLRGIVRSLSKRGQKKSSSSK